jgi:hypothetical protein
MTITDLYQQNLEKINISKIWVILIFQRGNVNLIIENKDIKSFVDAVNYVTPLELQDVEGMTEAFNLDLDTQNGERIKYYDVISLYTYRPVKLSYDMITEDF